jgi:hypothetical protein
MEKVMSCAGEAYGARDDAWGGRSASGACADWFYAGPPQPQE